MSNFILIENVPQSYSKSKFRSSIFSEQEIMDYLEKNEKLERQTTGISCTTNLFFGFSSMAFFGISGRNLINDVTRKIKS